MPEDYTESEPLPSEDPVFKKLQARKLEVEAQKLEAEAEKLRAEVRNSHPAFPLVKYAFAGLVAGVSCYLLLTKVMTDLYSLNKSRYEEAAKRLEEAKTAHNALKEEQAKLALTVEDQKAQIQAAKLESAKLADANKALSDQFTENTTLVTKMREELQRRIEKEQMNDQERERLKAQEAILTAALDSASRSIPRRANDTLGYLRIGQLDPRGYFISGKSAIDGNPSFQNLRIGQEYIAVSNYNVRAALPRNDALYHEGVAAVGLLEGGEKFLITEGPTVYFRDEDRDVWVGISRPPVVSSTTDSPDGGIAPPSPVPANPSP